MARAAAGRKSRQGHESTAMLSALLMLRRVANAMGYAVCEEDFLNVLGAAVTFVVVAPARERVRDGAGGGGGG